MLPSILLGRAERSLLSQSTRCCQKGATAITSCLSNRIIHCYLSQSTIRYKKWNIVRNWDLAETCKRYMNEVNRSLLWLNTLTWGSEHWHWHWIPWLLPTLLFCHSMTTRRPLWAPTGLWARSAQPPPSLSSRGWRNSWLGRCQNFGNHWKFSRSLWILSDQQVSHFLFNYSTLCQVTYVKWHMSGDICQVKYVK